MFGLVGREQKRSSSLVQIDVSGLAGRGLVMTSKPRRSRREMCPTSSMRTCVLPASSVAGWRWSFLERLHGTPIILDTDKSFGLSEQLLIMRQMSKLMRYKQSRPELMPWNSLLGQINGTVYCPASVATAHPWGSECTPFTLDILISFGCQSYQWLAVQTGLTRCVTELALYRSSAWMNCSEAISYIKWTDTLRRLKGWGFWSSKDSVVACLSDSIVSICYILYI
jgi:hypothetical protein